MQASFSKGSKCIAVISAGAVGSLFGGIIQCGKHHVVSNDIHVTFNCDYKAHYDAVKQKGLEITPSSNSAKDLWKVITKGSSIQKIDESYTTPINIVNSKELSQYKKTFDYVFILEKSYQTKNAALLAKQILKDDGVSITFQNGMGNVEILQDILGKDHVMQGSLTHNAFLKEPGHVIHGGTGYIMISPIQDILYSKAEWLTNMYKLIGLDSRLMTTEVDSILWSKLLVNAAINPLTAIMECKTGGLLSTSSLSMVKEIVYEGLNVIKALNIKLPVGDPYERVVEVIRQTQSSYSSMCSDVMRKRPTEIDAICGYISMKGKSLNVSTPLNDFLVDMIHSKEHLYLN